MKKNLKYWLLFGIVFIIIIGTLSHFIYEWSGYNKLMGLFVAVNESTWEHIKLAIFPALILMLIQYFYFKKSNNFFLGIFLSILAMILFIPAFFYSYQLIIGKDILVLDLLDFVLAVILGQYIFYKTMNINEVKKIYKIASIVGIFIILICFFTFTYYPPHNFLFKDPITNNYGI